MAPITFRRKTIRTEKTLGERLAAARGQLGLSLGQAERATRIRAKHLGALEQSRFDHLPEEVYTLGFLRRYAQFLGLDVAATLREYRGEYLAAQKLGWSRPIVDKPSNLIVDHGIREPRVVVTPKLFWIATSLTVILAIAGYLWYQVSGFMSAPNLSLASAAPEMVVATPTIQITGQTDGYAVVTINAEPVAIDPNGKFSQAVHLEHGLNTIEVSARNRLNKETHKELKVLANYDPPQGS